MIMELNKEGDEAARKLIESLRSFIVDTIREESYGGNRTCRPRLGSRAASVGADVNGDLLQAMKELFVVNPAFVRSNVTASEGCTEGVKLSSPSTNSWIYFGEKKRRKEKLSSKVDVKKFDSKNEEKDVSKLGLIEKCIIFDDVADDNEDLLDNNVFDNSEPDLVLSSTAAETKNAEKSLQNGTDLMHKSICNEEEQRLIANDFKLSEHFSDSGDGLGDSLLDSADSGVFTNMAGFLYERTEAEIDPSNGRKPNTSNIYSKVKGHSEESGQRPKESPSKSLPVNSTVCHGEPGLRSGSKIPVFSKSRRNSLADKKPKEKTWMQSLREGIMKFKDYDFGAASTPDKPSSSVERRHRSEAANESARQTRMQSAQSMMNLSYSSPRFQESTSFWEQRTSLEKDYSQYLEDEKRVLKDVKCDIEYQEANDFARRRPHEAKRKKSLSLLDLSHIDLSHIEEPISAKSGKQKHNMKRVKSICSTRYLGARGDPNNSITFRNRPLLRQSKIPVFIGHV